MRDHDSQVQMSISERFAHIDSLRVCDAIGPASISGFRPARAQDAKRGGGRGGVKKSLKKGKPLKTIMAPAGREPERTAGRQRARIFLDDF